MEMEKIVGSIISKKTGITYYVRWDLQSKYSWISKDKFTWTLVCTEVLTSTDAVACAQRYIDGQPNLY